MKYMVKVVAVSLLLVVTLLVMLKFKDLSGLVALLSCAAAILYCARSGESSDSRGTTAVGLSLSALSALCLLKTHALNDFVLLVILAALPLVVTTSWNKFQELHGSSTTVVGTQFGSVFVALPLLVAIAGGMGSVLLDPIALLIVGVAALSFFLLKSSSKLLPLEKSHDVFYFGGYLGIFVGLIYVLKVGGRLSEIGPCFRLMLDSLLFCNLAYLIVDDCSGHQLAELKGA